MPTYVFRNKDTNEFEEHIMRVAELDEFKKNNEHLVIQLQSPAPISDYKSVHTRAGSEWQDKLKDMKKKAGMTSTIKV